jgi:gamma-D-glutamyl-L-lysine dipeptidyl-peptidase
MEDTGICFQAFIPMRREPDEKSEMKSQVLYGESFTILESNKKTNFLRIILDHDNYEGWIDSKTIYPISEKDKESFFSEIQEVTHDLITVLTSGSGAFPLIIGCGSTIRTRERKVLDLIGNDYFLPENYMYSENKNIRFALENFGLRLLSIPYLWGGRSSFGFDCSGLCQNLFKQVGIIIPRDSGAQSSQGKVINFIEDAQTGDLAFFDNEEGDIIHVGMIINKNRVLHSSGKVKTDIIDDQGIFSVEQNRYTHHLRLIKNLID